MNTLSSAFGHVHLKRFPLQARQALRPWDAADEFVLAHLSESGILNHETRPLILNDGFGALSISLANYLPQVQSDSYLSLEAIRYNLKLNNLNNDQVTLLSSLEPPQRPVNLVVIKLPKSLAMLEDQLHRLRPFIRNNDYILGAAMAKHIHNSTLKLFETIIGKTTTSLARKKARLIFCQAELPSPKRKNPYPNSYELSQPAITLTNHAGVFSQGSLDIGSRFFLEHLPISDTARTIIDLGCGDGVVGIVAAYQNPHAHLHFLDESYMAIDCAKINFQRAFPSRQANFTTTHCLQGITPRSADLILNNPPFHQGHAVGDQIAWQMFQESFRVLKEGGQLWVIGNRHLKYHIKLKRLFGHCKTIASNKKFSIFSAVKQKQ